MWILKFIFLWLPLSGLIISHVKAKDDFEKSSLPSVQQFTEKRREGVVQVTLTPVYGYHSMSYQRQEQKMQKPSGEETSQVASITSAEQSLKNLSLEKENDFPNFSYLKASVTPHQQTVSKEGGRLEVGGLAMVIPQDAVQDNTEIRIQKAPEAIIPPAFVTPLTPIYEITPHKKRFADWVELSFDIPQNAGPVGLFVQKDDDQDRFLQKWTVIEPDYVTADKAVFQVKGFSFPFVGNIGIGRPVPLQSGQAPLYHPSYRIVKPGLNYRAVCESAGCQSLTDFVIIPRGFDKFTPNVEVDEGNLKCPHCANVFQDYESIQQLILYESDGVISYRLDQNPKPPVRKEPFSAQNGRFVLFGEATASDKYSSFSIEARPAMANPSPKKGAVFQLDAQGNPIGSEFDLGADGAFGHVKLLIGKFYNGHYQGGYESGFSEADFEGCVGVALSEKGFKWKVTEDEAEFLRELPEYHVAWIISGYVNLIKNKSFVQQVHRVYQSGQKGLMLWEDNDSASNTHTVEVLREIFGITVGGNDPGNKKMCPAVTTDNPLTFLKNHPMAQGIESLYEGVTISYPQQALPPEIKVFGRSSAGRPNIMYVDERPGKDSQGNPVTLGRIVIDCGFTKLFKDCWDSAGTARYVKNATCWLSGMPEED